MQFIRALKQLRCFLSFGHSTISETIGDRPPQLRCTQCGDVWVDLEAIRARETIQKLKADRKRADEEWLKSQLCALCGLGIEDHHPIPGVNWGVGGGGPYPHSFKQFQYSELGSSQGAATPVRHETENTDIDVIKELEQTKQE